MKAIAPALISKLLLILLALAFQRLAAIELQCECESMPSLKHPKGVPEKFGPKQYCDNAHALN